MYLGIDIGTSSVKVILVDENQTVVGQVSQELSIQQDKPLHSEQDPYEWYDKVLKALYSIQQMYPSESSQICSVGLTGQMHGAVCLNIKGEVIRPAILWNDGRSYQECHDLMHNNPDFEKVGANKVMPGFTAPKLLWIKRNEPEIFNKIDKVLLPKDYIRYKLTGEFASDMSDASGTLWMDIAQRKWSSSLLSSCDLKEHHMPTLLEGNDLSGYLKPEVQNILKAQKKVKVIAGASDNAAGALSMGIYQDNDAMISLGTSGVYFVPNQTCLPNTKRGLHTFCHALDGLWHQMGVILSAASALSWWKNIIKTHSESELIDLAKKSKHINTPLFLPYLSGERTPHNNPFAQAAFIGITHSTELGDMVQAVLEGVAYAIADCQDAILETGVQINSLAIIGGGSKSPYWGDIIASSIHQELTYHNESSVGPAFGAARLAIYENTQANIADVFYKPTINQIITPKANMKVSLANKLEIYRIAYYQLQTVFQSIGELS